MNASEKADELAAPFMVAEFETLTSRILALQETRATRVNYYILIVTAAVGGLALTTDLGLGSGLYRVIVPVLSLALFLLGMAILNENLGLAAQSVFIFRRAGRIRCWFRDKNPGILPYLPWSAGDDTPTFNTDPGHSTFGGKDSILLLGNAASGAAFVFSILYGFSPPQSLWWIAFLAIAVAICFAIWWGQNRYIKYLMGQYEKMGSEKGRIHFPRPAQSGTTPKKDT